MTLENATMKNGIGGAKCHTFPKIANFCKFYFRATSLFPADKKKGFNSFKSFKSYILPRKIGAYYYIDIIYIV